MKGEGRVYWIAALVAAALAAGVGMVPASGPAGAGSRELHIVARDMAFYVEGQDQPNPTLRFRAGEEVRLVFRNEDAGMDHDFAIRTWGVGTKLLEGPDQDVVTFRVPPDGEGSGSYACTPHSQMMRGAIAVE